MRAAATLAEDQRRALAQLSADIHAPLANRLGIWQLKWELEDLAFRYLQPETYRRIAGLLDEKRGDREGFIEEAKARLREALQARGFELAPDAGSSKATLQFRGDMVLMGGPKFHKGVKAPIGETTEKALKLAKESGQVMTADVVQTTAGVALNAAALNASLNNFTRGLAISGIANALGDATGMRSWFNTAVAGDPRGICLSRCEDWNKVDQTVYLWVTLDSKAAGRKEIRILSKAISDTVAPEQVIAYAVDKAIELIRID